MGNEMSRAGKKARFDALHGHYVCYDCNARNSNGDRCRKCGGSDFRRKKNVK